MRLDEGGATERSWWLSQPCTHRRERHREDDTHVALRSISIICDLQQPLLVTRNNCNHTSAVISLPCIHQPNPLWFFTISPILLANYLLFRLSRSLANWFSHSVAAQLLQLFNEIVISEPPTFPQVPLVGNHSSRVFFNCSHVTAFGFFSKCICGKYEISFLNLLYCISG